MGGGLLVGLHELALLATSLTVGSKRGGVGKNKGTLRDISSCLRSIYEYAGEKAHFVPVA